MVGLKSKRVGRSSLYSREIKVQAANGEAMEPARRRYDEFNGECRWIYRAMPLLQKKKYEPPIPTRIGKRKKRTRGPEAANKLPQVLPYTRCRLKQLRSERIKDYLLLEEEFIKNQERLKPQEDRQEVGDTVVGSIPCPDFRLID